jgi:hypothetical protein
MRFCIVTLGVVALVLATGCGRKEGPATATDSSSTLVRWHFVGTGQLAADTNAAKLKSIWDLPETQRVVEQTAMKLSHTARTLFPDSVDPAQDQRVAALLRPMIDELPRTESYGQVRRDADRPVEWTLLVRLSANRSGVWSSNITELMGVLKAGDVTTKSSGGTASHEVRRTGNPGVIRWAVDRDWFALSVGRESTPALDGAMRQIKQSGRPVGVASNYWLETELDLPRLARLVDFRPQFRWPSIQLSVTGRGEDLRTTGRMTYSEPSTGPMEAWRIPTNVMTEPLISFTTARGVEPLLRSSQVFSRLGIEPVPNQFFVWAQSSIPFQTFWAWPSHNATNNLPIAAQRAREILGTTWQQRGLAQIEWQSTNRHVIWKGLPVVLPFLRSVNIGSQEFVLGGLFPTVATTNPPPPELLAQVTSRSNLVYYDWEITQDRLAQWTILNQTASVIANKSQFRTNLPALPWLGKVGPLLGNTITEVTADSPTQWSLVRRSHMGLTGFEIVALVRWLESTNFPGLGIDLPSVPTTSSVKPAAGTPPK